MLLTVRPIAREEARTMLSWRYEPPYDVYNFRGRTQRDVEDTVTYILDESYRFHSLIDERGEFVAFCSYGRDGQVAGGDYSEEALDIGMGVRPDLTGRGLGRFFRDTVLDHARRTYQYSLFRVTVAEFNRRAMRLWQNAGFQIVDRFRADHNDMPFAVLTRQACE